MISQPPTTDQLTSTVIAVVLRVAGAVVTDVRPHAIGTPHRQVTARIGDVLLYLTDPRTVDLSIDPSDRPYGSLFGRRPDLIDYGQVGFGRLTTPEAWLSTWSGLSSNADFVRCAPGVTVPTLFVELTGDQAAFPSDSARMVAALGARDLTHRALRGTHFGGAITPGEPTGNDLAGEAVSAWLAERFELAPPR